MLQLSLLLLTALAPSWFEANNSAGPWNVSNLKNLKIEPVWGESKNGVKEVYYQGENYKGKPTKVFAYYGKPEGQGPFPAVLLVHGGGGKAFPDWVKHWNKRGYCALAMDLAGNGPNGRLPDGGPGQGDEEKFLNFQNDTIKDMWTYHAVAAVIRGHSMIASFPEVDRNKVVVTGISWGGYLTCIIAGLDDRLKAAVPVYGCGFLHENSVWKESRLDKMDVQRRLNWVRNFDPSSYLPNVGCPIMFINGTNDFAYPLDSYKKCYDLVKEKKTLSIKVRMPHGHIWTFKEVDAFIDSHVKNGIPLVKLNGLETKDGEAIVKFSSSVPVKSAMLNYAINDGPWQKRQWESVKANLSEGNASAKIPMGKPIVYYISVIDDRGLEVSSNHLISP
ncbi:alpha/beta fold hydrolase [bacterium]|nr:alpha/beta fold hydrolase [bacterium]